MPTRRTRAPLALVAVLLSGLSSSAQPGADRPLPDLIKNFERDYRKALADGNYDVIQLNNEKASYIYACVTLRLKSDFAIELCEQLLARDRERGGLGQFGVSHTISQLVQLYQAAGKHDRAVALLEEYVRWHREEYGEKNPHTVGVSRHLVRTLVDGKRYDRAVELLRSLLAGHKEASPEKLNLLTELMGAYQKAGKFDLELATGREALEHIKKLGKDQFRRAHSVRLLLGKSCVEAGKQELAREVIEGDLQESRKDNGADHPATLALLAEVAERYFAAGQPERALASLVEAVELRTKKDGADHPDTLLARSGLAEGHYRAGRRDEAIKHSAAVLPKLKEKLGATHHKTQAALTLLSDAYELSGKVAEAEPLRRDYLEVQRKLTPVPDAPQVGTALALLGLNLLRQEKWADAEKVLRECLASRRKWESRSWTTFNAASLVGASLLGQKKYQEAEPLLREGYEGMKQRETSIPPQGRIRVTEALERLVNLYDETGRKDRADELRKLLPPAKQP
jgi:eukaryotic-like serine/threonine-protein kinase